MHNTSLFKLETIVVATDFSESSSTALSYARTLAKAYGARVVLAHVIDPVAYANVADVPARVLADLTNSAREAIEKQSAELLSAGIHSNSVVRQGVVTQLLVQVIDQYHADLLVLGTHGAQGAGQVALGSVVEQLVRLAPCPVLAVAADAVEARSEGLSGCRILVPVERNEASLDAIAAAQSLASHFLGSLILLHARGGKEVAAMLNPCADTMEKLSFPQAAIHVPIRCMVKDGRPAEVVQATVEQYGVSLIVMGVNRESRAKGLSPHGTAYEVLARARAAVLCVPPAVIPRHVELSDAAVVETCSDN